MRLKQLLLLLAVLVGLAAYLAFFYGTELPDVRDSQGRPMSRGMLVAFWLLQPDELVKTWLGAPVEFSLLDRLPVLGIAGGILGFASVLGWLVLVPTRIARGLNRPERFVFSTATGLNLISSYVLVVGLFGGLHRLVPFTVPAVVVLAAASGLWWHRARIRRSAAGLEAIGKTPVTARGKGSGKTEAGSRGTGKMPAALGKRPETVRKHESKAVAMPRDGDRWLSTRWLWLAVPFALVILLGGMLPPFEFDVREYHLQVPKEFYQQGRIAFLPHNVYGNMAMGTEMLSLLAMILARDWWLGALAGKTVTAAFALLTALGLWTAGRRFASPTAGVVAAVTFISTAWVVQVSTLGLIEGASACYLFLAVYAMVLYGRSADTDDAGVDDQHLPTASHPDRSPDRAAGATEDFSSPPEAYRPDDSAGSKDRRQIQWLLLAGYLAGGAVSTKYPAALFVAVPLTLWLVWLHLRSRRSSLWKPMTALVLALVVGCGLWFAKNWVLAGNPTYPLLYEVFGGKTWTPEKNQRWNRAHRPHDFSFETLGKDLARVAMTSSWLNPLLVPLAVVAFVNRRHWRLVLALAGYFIYVIAVWWLATHRIDRFWIPAMPILALLAGLGASWTPAGPWRRILAGVLILGCVANFVVVASPVIGDSRYFVRLERLRDDPLRLDAWHRYYNTQGTRGRLLLVGEAQVFDLEPPLLYNTCFDSSIFEQLVRNHSPEQIRQALAAQGITDVYVSWGEIARYRSPGNYGFTDFVQPEVFQWLVERGVLEPLPDIPDHLGRGYRVRPEKR